MNRRLRRDFDINILALENRDYEFDYSISSDFFAEFEPLEIEEGFGKIKLVLTKSERMLQLVFDLDCQVKLICDISLRPYNMSIRESHQLILKFGDENKELSDEIVMIKRDTDIINVSDYMYEYISLAIPMKKVHPELDDENRPELVYISETIQENEENIDPRWSILKKLKNNE